MCKIDESSSSSSCASNSPAELIPVIAPIHCPFPCFLPPQSASLHKMLLSVILGSLALFASGLDCDKFDSNMGATFDLSDLSRSEEHHQEETIMENKQWNCVTCDSHPTIHFLLMLFLCMWMYVYVCA